MLHRLLGRAPFGRLGSGVPRVLHGPGAVDGGEGTAVMEGDRRERRIGGRESLVGLRGRPVESQPARRRERSVEGVLDERVGEEVAIALVHDHLGRDRLGERGRHDIGIDAGGRRERGQVEAATEHAGGREHAPGVLGEEIHPSFDRRANVAGQLRIRHHGEGTATSLGFAWAGPSKTTSLGRAL